VLTITKTCDRCGRTVDNKEHSWSVWNTFNFMIPWGVARTNVSVDMCPYCQDDLFYVINAYRKDNNKEPITYRNKE
jgi:hypothetical protein